MVGPVSDTFEIQDPVRIRDGPTLENEAEKRSSGFITPRKSFLIFGISLIGVLAIAGVAVGVSSSSGSDSAVAESGVLEPPLDDGSFPAHLIHPRDHKKVKHFQKTEIETPKVSPKYIPKNKKSPRADVCETSECAESAATIIASLDESVDPCEDFYEFACGGWYAANPVTNESLGTFYDADDLIQGRLKDILESEPNPGDPEPVIEMRIHYSTCLDTDTMDSVGLSPMWTQMSVFGGWPMVMDEWNSSNFDLEEALVHTLKLDVYPIIWIAISADFLNTSNKILYVDYGELGTSSTYLENPDDYETELGYYKTYIIDSAKLVRDSIGSSVTDDSISQEVDELVDFEAALGDVMSFIPRNVSDILVKTTITGLQQYTDSGTPGQFDWLFFFKTLFGQTDVVISDEEPLYIFDSRFFTRLSNLLSETSERTLANYFGWWWSKTTGYQTTYAMRDVENQYYEDLDGITSFEPRSDYCQDQTNNNLGFPLSRAYIDEYFPNEAKVETTLLVELIRDAFQSLLDENTWMAPEDIVVAKEKLDAIVDHVAYPDWIMDNALITLAYQGLEINAGEQYNNIMRMDEYYHYWNLETFRNEASKVFLMPPTVVNAFYDVFTNSITILAGILQPPFYMHNSLAALNYGGIGMVIGHEFTHGFDNTGRHFDKDGNYANWWSDETVDAFNERSQCFVEQYDVYSPPELDGTEYENMTVDGQQTLGENIADNGGIREAFRAYTTYVESYGEEPPLPGLEQYSPYQLFFISFATVWCEHQTTLSVVSQLESDPHSPGRFRVIGSLSNDADFSATFNCSANSAMNRGPDSCVLW